VLLAPPYRAAAQERADLVTDRPDFTESPVTVPRGSVQVETGSTWERAGGVSSLTAPEVLLRWGSWGTVELRLGLPDYVRAFETWSRSDASLGLKVGLRRFGAWETALIETLMLPVGDAVIGADDGVAGQFILTTGRDLGDRMSVGSQVSATLGTGDSANKVDFGSTVVLGMGLTDRVATFAELALDGLEDRGRALVFHHGYAWQVSPLLQLDVHAAYGLTDSAPSAQVGVGLATRFRR